MADRKNNETTSWNADEVRRQQTQRKQRKKMRRARFWACLLYTSQASATARTFSCEPMLPGLMRILSMPCRTHSSASL